MKEIHFAKPAHSSRGAAGGSLEAIDIPQVGEKQAGLNFPFEGISHGVLEIRKGWRDELSQRTS